MTVLFLCLIFKNIKFLKGEKMLVNMADFKIDDPDVIVKKGVRFHIPKCTLKQLTRILKRKWFYKPDVVNALKNHYNHGLLLHEAPEVINNLIDLYSSMRNEIEGRFRLLFIFLSYTSNIIYFLGLLI